MTTGPGGSNISDLQQQGDVEGLVQVLERPEYEVRLAAVRALWTLDDPRAAEALASVAADDPMRPVRDEAAAALRARGDARGELVSVAAPGVEKKPKNGWVAKLTKDFFSARGRINRAIYIWRVLIWDLLVVYPIMLVRDAESVQRAGAAPYLLLFLSFLAGMVLILQVVKRLHDFGHSGWLWLLLLVPLANFVLGVLLIFMPTNKGWNKYGPDPLEAGEAAGVRNEAAQTQPQG